VCVCVWGEKEAGRKTVVGDFRKMKDAKDVVS